MQKFVSIIAEVKALHLRKLHPDMKPYTPRSSNERDKIDNMPLLVGDCSSIIVGKSTPVLRDTVAVGAPARLGAVKMFTILFFYDQKFLAVSFQPHFTRQHHVSSKSYT